MSLSEKAQKIESINARYQGIEDVSWMTPIQYLSTDKLFHEYGASQPSGTPVILKYSLWKSIVGICFILIVAIPFLSELRNTHPWAFGIVLTTTFILLSALLISLFGRRPQIIIDEQGIWSADKDETSRWSDILTTHILLKGHRNKKICLVINYCGESGNNIIERIIRVDHLNMKYQKLAVALESVRQRIDLK